MKKKGNETTLKQAIDRLLETYRLSSKMRELDIIQSWEEMMGKAIARRTKEIYFKDKTLFIHLESSVLREELMMGRSKIMQMINEKAGSEIVTDVVFK